MLRRRPARRLGANRAHHADVGGAAPGSIPADATEIFQEGLRIPPVRLTDEVRALLLANSRTPGERRGDLDAQVGANVGRRRQRLADAAPDARRSHEVLDYGERRMRAALAALPDGTWASPTSSTRSVPRPTSRSPTRIAVAVTIAGDAITFDFTGTDRSGWAT